MTHGPSVPRLGFYRDAEITTLESSHAWRREVISLSKQEGLAATAFRRDTWLAAAKPLSLFVVGPQEFQRFHASLGLEYGIRAMLNLGDHIDRHLSEKSNEPMTGIPTRLRTDQVHTPRGLRSRLVLETGGKTAGEKREIHAITEEYYDEPGVPEDVWGPIESGTVLAMSAGEQATYIVGIIKGVLERDDRLLAPTITAGPMYYSDNRAELQGA